MSVRVRRVTIGRSYPDPERVEKYLKRLEDNGNIWGVVKMPDTEGMTYTFLDKSSSSSIRGVLKRIQKTLGWGENGNISYGGDEWQNLDIQEGGLKMRRYFEMLGLLPKE